jgi:hypothetical protein
MPTFPFSKIRKSSMKEVALFLVLFFALNGCGISAWWGRKVNDIEVTDGVSVSSYDDYTYDDLPNRDFFSSLRLFVSDGAYFEDSRFYYIFWNDGRCFYSSGRDPNEINIQDILNDKRGKAGYYKISDNVVWIEFYTHGTFLYNYFELTESGMKELGQKGRKPNKTKMRAYSTPYYLNFEEQFTTPTSDSLYFNNDSIAMWQPFW